LRFREKEKFTTYKIFTTHTYWYALIQSKLMQRVILNIIIVMNDCYCKNNPST